LAFIPSTIQDSFGVVSTLPASNTFFILGIHDLVVTALAAGVA
jgi:hypothetical protein